MKIVPLKKKHVESLEDVPYGQSKDELFSIVDVKGSAFAGVHEGQVIGMGGIVPLRMGLGEGWLIFPRKTAKIPVSAMSQAKKTFESIIKEWGYWRVECNVREDFYQGLRTARILGFQKEHSMLGWGINMETFIKMSWIDKERIWQQHQSS